MGKGIWPALGVAGMLLLAPPASAATVRHASPDGVNSGSTCTDGEQPCSLKRAVETVAVAGDDVILAPGIYTPTSTVSINKAIEVHGQTRDPASPGPPGRCSASAAAGRSRTSRRSRPDS